MFFGIIGYRLDFRALVCYNIVYKGTKNYRTFGRIAMRKVIGQTGSVVLSDDMLGHQRDKKRTVRYRYQKVRGGWLCEVIGPFHSALYGVNSYGTLRTSAKKALIRRLANDYRYLGHLLFSDVDAGDSVGIVDSRTIQNGDAAIPITKNVLVGSAGQ